MGRHVRTIRITAELTYDDHFMHGDDPESIDWFVCDILMGGCGEDLILHSNEIGDEVGTVRCVKVEGITHGNR